MIPFIQPYTAPDGTARRPLCERVPEVCPINHETLRFVGRDRKNDEPGEGCISGAHWRVAVEDWITDDKGASIWLVKCAKPENRPCCEITDEREQLCRVHGATKVDALNAAAHAVADAMGIAP